MILNNLKQQIIDILNQSNISIDAIYFMMKDIMNDVDIAYHTAIQREIAETIQQDNKQGSPIDSQVIEKKEE